MTRAIRPSRSMWMKALGVKPSAASTWLPPAGTGAGRRGERESLSARLLDRFANADIGAAAADVAGHRIVYVRIGRTGIALDECRRGHDLARLAVTALNDLAIEPRLLDPGARRGRADDLDGGDLRAADDVDRGDAGTRGDTVDMHRAGAAQRHAAA